MDKQVDIQMCVCQCVCVCCCVSLCVCVCVCVREREREREKTKVLSIGCKQARVLLDRSILENVTEFTYLGSIMSQDGGFIADIDARISKASKVFGLWKKKVFTNRQF